MWYNQERTTPFIQQGSATHMMHEKWKKDRRHAIDGARRALCVLCALLLAAYLVPAFAADGDAVFLFPFEGFRFEAPQTARVLTQHNLSEHADLLTGFGTDEAAVLAAMHSSNTIMEVFPAEGGQIELTLAGAEGIATGSSPRMDEGTREALLAAYAGMPRYREVAYSAEQPDWLRMEFSTQQGGMPVFTVRYVTVAHGQQYLLSSAVIGRSPEEADDAQLLDVIGRITFLVAPATPAPTSTPAPTAMPESTPAPTSTPRPTPGAAEQLRQEPDEEVTLLVDPPPAWTELSALTVTGTVDAGASVRMLLDGQQIAEGRVRSNGAFSVTGTLPGNGDYEITIEARMRGGKTASQTYTVRMEAPKLWLHVTEPTETLFRTEGMVKGKTEPGARIDIRGGGMAGNARANDRGDFSFRIKLPSEGEYTYALTVSLKGYETYETSHTVVREFTPKEALDAFRKALIRVDYNRLLRDPEAYAGKRASYRGRVMAIGDSDGKPCLLLYTELQSGKWTQPIWVLCDGAPPFGVDEVFLAYVQFNGELMPYTGADSKKTDIPVAELRFHTK